MHSEKSDKRFQKLFCDKCTQKHLTSVSKNYSAKSNNLSILFEVEGKSRRQPRHLKPEQQLSSRLDLKPEKV